MIRRPVLTVQEQATFLYHQQKFAKSHSEWLFVKLCWRQFSDPLDKAFYRPHETETHRVRYSV